jgi:hypothetical protein
VSEREAQRRRRLVGGEPLQRLPRGRRVVVPAGVAEPISQEGTRPGIGGRALDELAEGPPRLRLVPRADQRLGGGGEQRRVGEGIVPHAAHLGQQPRPVGGRDEQREQPAPEPRVVRGHLEEAPDDGEAPLGAGRGRVELLEGADRVLLGAEQVLPDRPELPGVPGAAHRLAAEELRRVRLASEGELIAHPQPLEPVRLGREHELEEGALVGTRSPARSAPGPPPRPPLASPPTRSRPHPTRRSGHRHPPRAPSSARLRHDRHRERRSVCLDPDPPVAPHAG